MPKYIARSGKVIRLYKSDKYDPPDSIEADSIEQATRRFLLTAQHQQNKWTPISQKRDLLIEIGSGHWNEKEAAEFMELIKAQEKVDKKDQRFMESKRIQKLFENY